MDADDPEPSVSNWELIASQDSDLGFFSINSQTTFLENENDPSNSSFMNIGNLIKEDYKDEQKYKFKLIWDGGPFGELGVNKEGVWKQSSWLTENYITGFEEIGNSGFVTGDVNTGFWGLGKSDYSNSCIIDGNGLN